MMLKFGKTIIKAIKLLNFFDHVIMLAFLAMCRSKFAQKNVDGHE